LAVVGIFRYGYRECIGFWGDPVGNGTMSETTEMGGGGRNSWVEMLKRLVFCALLLAVGGCGQDEEPVRIDFTKTGAAVSTEVREASQPVLRVAVAAMISPQQTFGHYRRLLDYLGERLGYRIDLVQRKTYQEINELIARDRIDLAFVCSGPYAAGKNRYGFIPVAAPLVRGGHLYRSYLIVHRDSAHRRLEDLAGKVFAFTDPDSLTGRLAPSHWVAELGQTPEAFFSQVIYTFSHDNSILAVARRVVDGAAVDSLVWEFLQHRDPRLTAQTRVIKQSEPFGIPPLVASTGVPADTLEAVRRELFSMHEQEAGREILDQLMIERFVVPDDSWYDGIRDLQRQLSPERSASGEDPNT